MRSGESPKHPSSGSPLPTITRTIISAPLRFAGSASQSAPRPTRRARRRGASALAPPGRRVLASEAGEDALIADWVRVVGLDAMRGFEFADTPDRPVTGTAPLRLGQQTFVITHPRAA